MNLKELKLYEDASSSTTSSNIASIASPLPVGRVIKRGDRKKKSEYFFESENDDDFYNFLLEAKDENLNELVDLFKNGKNGWNILLKPSFKKKFRKYNTDQKVTTPLLELIKFITKHNKKPSSHDYPSELYVHNIVKGKHAGKIWSHLKGQKIGLMFQVRSDKTITLVDMGTHQDFGW